MLTRDYTFDVENRLASVKTGNQMMSFAYDADGQRVMTTRHDGTIVYTPFPDYEVEDPPTGSNITRTTYRLAGQVVAIRKNDGTNNKLYYLLSDHLGNIIAISDVDGNLESGSNTRYFPFGAFETTPPSSNPSISNHGFTGHRHNNTGANDLGLIYMNARYYLPEVGRFISPDTIVPDPSNPQSFNRYSYAHNDPTNLTDPSGYCAGDPNDPENSDRSCWSRLLYLQEYYRLVLSGDWHFNELLDLFLSLRDLEDMLGGIAYFLAAFGGTQLHREQGVANDPSGFSAQAASPFKMTFWDSAFTAYEQFETRWLVAHEFGHIWDARHLLSSSFKLEQATGGSSCLVEAISHCLYSPGGRTVSGYAAENRREDWAESFAAFTYGGNWSDIAASSMHFGISPEALIVDPTRIIAVTTEILSFQRRVHADTLRWGYIGVGGW